MIDSMNQKTDQFEILLVDDTPDNLELLSRILKRSGYRVRPAPSGQLALQSVEARLPDLILLDVKMPEMDGFEVCRRLKSNEQSRNVPVIFISAHGEVSKKVEGFNAGGVDFIGKPFEREEVLIRVKTQLQLRKLTGYLEHEVNKRTAELTLANQQLRQEIAERKRAEENLCWEVQVNHAAAELSRKMLSTASIDDVSCLMLEHAKNLTGSASGFVGCIDAKTDYLVCPDNTRDFWEVGEADNKNIVLKEFTGLWGWVLHNKKSLITNTPADDPRSSEMCKDHIQIHRFLSAPALIENTLVGQVSVANSDKDYSNRELEVIERLSNLYAIAIHRSQAVEELRKHRDQLEELVSERTAALKTANKELESFAYSVSHDLQAPLRYFKGVMELLQKRIETALDDKSRYYIKTILDTSNRMGVLIDDLLSFSRMERQSLCTSDVNLQILVQEVVNELGPETEGRNINWQIHNLPTVSADQTLIRVVLVNLISNALKFTRSREIAEIEISCYDEQTEHVIFVRDNGVGFKKEFSERLFGVFQRLHRKEEYEGTGIGLSNVRRIINRHNGRVWAESEVDKGAAFFFSLQNLESK